MPPEIARNFELRQTLTTDQKIDAVYAAMLGGSFEHPEGIVHELKKHHIALYGEDGKTGLIADMEDYKRIRVISKAVYVAIGVLFTVFGPAVGKFLAGLFLVTIAKVAPH